MKSVAGQGDVPMRSPTSVQAPHQVSDTAQSILDRFFLGAQPQAGAPAAPPAPGQTSAPPPAPTAPGGSPYAAPPASGSVADDWRQFLPQITPGMHRDERPGGIAGTVAGLNHLMQALGRDWEPNDRMKRAMRIQAGNMGPSQAQPATPPAPAPQVTQPNYAAGGSQPVNPLLAMMMGG